MLNNIAMETRALDKEISDKISFIIPFNEKLFYHECHENDILWNVNIIIE